MSKPKVLLLGKLPPPYMGPSIATKILLDSKLKAEFTLLHLDTNVHKDMSTVGLINLGKVGKNLKLYLNFFKMNWKHKPDLILVPISQSTYGFIKDSIFIIMGKMFGRKTIIHLRGSNIQNWLKSTSLLIRAYAGFVFKCNQGVIVLGGKLRYLFSDYFKKDRIFVVPNGADFDYPDSQSDNDPLKILYLSNLQPSKGIEDVLNAMVILKDRYQKKFTIDVVGAWRDQSVKDRCEQIAEDNKLRWSYHAPVFGKQKARFLQEADIFVFPPREPEGHPWVIVEALAAGLPIISTDQGAITESVIDGVNGFIVPENDPQKITEKIKILMDNPDLRKKMGKAGRLHYEKNFTEENMVENLSHCFRAVLGSS